MHVFTGCDTVSALARKGKGKALKTPINSKDYQDYFNTTVTLKKSHMAIAKQTPILIR